MSTADEFRRLAEEAEAKAKATNDPAAQSLWESVADEWHEAEKAQRAVEGSKRPLPGRPQQN
jgi:hypothetical protein